MIMDLSGRHVVVTGGTGALGTAVVQTVVSSGATCMVPYVHESEAQRFPVRDQKQVTLLKVSDLSDEAEVSKVYAGKSSPLWASIHLAGGFAPGKVAETDRTALMTQVDNNFVSCFICCRAAVSPVLAAGHSGCICHVKSVRAHA